MNVATLQDLVLYKYRYYVAYATVVIASFGTVLYKLPSLVPGLATVEVNQGLAVSADSTTILEQGYYLPYNILQTLSYELIGESVLSSRLPAAVIALLTLGMIFALLHMWHKDKIAIASVLFMATASWFLHFSRLGTPFISLAFSICLLLLSGAMIRHATKRHMLPLFFAAVAIPLSLYTPFMIYIILLFVFLYRTQIGNLLRETSTAHIAMYATVSGVFLLPLAYGLFQDVENVKFWLGIQSALPSITGYLENVLSVIQHILWRSEENVAFHLGNLPMLDILTSTMTALGLYHYEQHHKYLRTKFLMYGFGLTVLVLGLNANQENYFILTPFIYIFAATGIVTLLNQWNKIFPLNPIARTLALLPLAFAVLITSQYHIDRYFSAWALNPETKAEFAIEPTLLESAAQQQINSIPASRTLIVSEPDSIPAIRLLLGEATRNPAHQINIVGGNEITENTIDTEVYNFIYIDSRVEIDTSALDDVVTNEIESPRESNPVPYQEFLLDETPEIIF